MQGAIIPFDPVRQYTEEAVKAPTTLRIYPGGDGDYTLYEDDGTSLDYLKGEANWIHLVWNDKARTLTLRPGAPDGNMSMPVSRSLRLRLMTGRKEKTFLYQGKEMSIRL